MCSSWNGSCSLYTARSGSRMLPMRRNYLESNFTSMFVYVRDWSSPHMQAFFVFVCCWNGRNALIQRSRPTKKRKLACACSAWHALHTASYDLTNRSIANRATPINITMETPLMTRRNNWSFMIYFFTFTFTFTLRPLHWRLHRRYLLYQRGAHSIYNRRQFLSSGS